MTIRIAASVLAIVAIGSIVAPAEIAARGIVAGHTMPAGVGAVHQPIVRAFPRVRTPVARFRPRRFFDNGFPAGVWGDTSGYGGNYDPAADAVPYDAPPDTYPTAGSLPPYAGPVRERIIYVVPTRPSCSTQTYKVPAEGGGERAVNVIRC